MQFVGFVKWKWMEKEMVVIDYVRLEVLKKFIDNAKILHQNNFVRKDYYFCC